jgi:PIN domain nuclease of toxin-antitoxin system
MKILPDSHLLVWYFAQSEKLPNSARLLMAATENQLFFSSASIWELTIKFVAGRSDFTFPPSVLRKSLLDNGFTEVPITSKHGLGVANLPPIHKDPFDRILIAQAIAEDMVLMTSDETIAQYEGPIQLVR